MISKRTSVMIGLAGLLALALPASAQHHYRTYDYDQYDRSEFRVHVGAFRPDGSSAYWTDIRNEFTGSDPSDFEDADFGIDYLLPVNPYMSVIFSGSWYEGTSTNDYRNYLDNFNHRIRHDTTLDIGSATVGLVFHPLPPGTAIQPYIGVGGGAYPWRLVERGDFIDFTTANNAIFTDRLSASGTSFGYYGLVGLEAPITRHTSIFAEGRWTRVRDDLNRDFDTFGRIDLGGREIAAGLAWKL